ncbi:response regulator [candidate division KSB1 bacterium]|nr:response regulator [candidate division KSB1 bacterium]
MNKTKVMVVDDNPEIRLFFKNVLDFLKYDSVIAENGIEALKLFKDVNPDIVFLDINLPFIDGFEILSRMRHLDAERETPIIMISGMEEQTTACQAMKLGAYDFLSKPIDFDSIKLVCEKAVHKFDKITADCEV